MALHLYIIRNLLWWSIELVVPGLDFVGIAVPAPGSLEMFCELP